MSGSRDLILAGVRQALAIQPAPASAPSDASVRDLYPEGVDLFEEFARRFTAVGGSYHRVKSPDDLPAVLAEIMAVHQHTEIALAPSAQDAVPGIGEILTNLGCQIRSPEPETAEKAPVGLTGVSLALAYSGSLVLDSREPGNLSASLLPSVHIALVPAARLVYGVNQALDLLDSPGRPRSVVFITGPSRTADIELTLVMGVHGPGSVHAVIID
jgi:L-lactate dehydrogenase complex protein LldG